MRDGGYCAILPTSALRGYLVLDNDVYSYFAELDGEVPEGVVIGTHATGVFEQKSALDFDLR